MKMNEAQKTGKLTLIHNQHTFCTAPVYLHAKLNYCKNMYHTALATIMLYHYSRLTFYLQWVL